MKSENNETSGEDQRYMGGGFKKTRGSVTVWQEKRKNGNVCGC